MNELETEKKIEEEFEKNKKLDLTVKDMIRIYMACVFLTPFGLYYFFKYRKSTKKNERAVAINCLVLTLVLCLFYAVSLIIIYNSYKSISTYYLEQYRIIQEL